MKFTVTDVRNVQGGENTSLDVFYRVEDTDGTLLAVNQFRISAAFLRLETVGHIIRQTMINHYYATNNLPAIIEEIKRLEFETGIRDSELGNKAYGTS